jgi:pyruvate dehydrogenase E1 component alpha subunit
LDKKLIAEIDDDIVKYAEESPEPDVAELEKYVLADNDPYVRINLGGGAS